MNYRKAVCCLFALGFGMMTAFNPIASFSKDSPAAVIERAKAAIESARLAGAEKTAHDDLTQAKSWLCRGGKGICSFPITLVPECQNCAF